MESDSNEEIQHNEITVLQNVEKTPPCSKIWRPAITYNRNSTKSLNFMDQVETHKKSVNRNFNIAFVQDDQDEDFNIEPLKRNISMSQKPDLLSVKFNLEPKGTVRKQGNLPINLPSGTKQGNLPIKLPSSNTVQRCNPSITPEMMYLPGMYTATTTHTSSPNISYGSLLSESINMLGDSSAIQDSSYKSMNILNSPIPTRHNRSQYEYNNTRYVCTFLSFSSFSIFIFFIHKILQNN